MDEEAQQRWFIHSSISAEFAPVRVAAVFGPEARAIEIVGGRVHHLGERRSLQVVEFFPDLPQAAGVFQMPADDSNDLGFAGGQIALQ
ncbi:MAG TPA: hypothetical protein EYP49_07830 [Anaerolineae bacterium]|nr:hypothetical protein [Anaerolineae bacterium]